MQLGGIEKVRGIVVKNGEEDVAGDQESKKVDPLPVKLVDEGHREDEIVTI